MATEGPAIIGTCSLFGFALAVAGFLTGAVGIRHLVVTGLVILEIAAIVRPSAVGVRPLPEKGWGLVLGPDSLPARGVPLLLVRGDGSLRLLTTDRTGRFLLWMPEGEYQHASLLICVPGGIPYVAHPIENSVTLTRYRITARAARANLPSDFPALGWQYRIPRECLVDWVDRRQITILGLAIS